MLAGELLDVAPNSINAGSDVSITSTGLALVTVQVDNVSDEKRRGGWFFVERILRLFAVRMVGLSLLVFLEDKLVV